MNDDKVSISLICSPHKLNIVLDGWQGQRMRVEYYTPLKKGFIFHSKGGYLEKFRHHAQHSEITFHFFQQHFEWHSITSTPQICFLCNINNIPIVYRPQPMEMVSSVPSSSASNDDFDDEPLLKKLCVLLCMLQNAPECASKHPKLSKFPRGACPRANNCRGTHVLYFS